MILLMKNFPKINLQILNLKEKSGAMKSRIAGVKLASGKLLHINDVSFEKTNNSQSFELNFFHDIRHKDSGSCVDTGDLSLVCNR